MNTALADILIAPVWLAVNLLLILSAWKVARRLYPSDALFELLKHTVVIWLAWVVGTATILGAAGVLHSYSLLAGVGGLASLLLWWAHRSLVPATRSDCTSSSLLSSDATERRWLVIWSVLLAFWASHVAIDGLLNHGWFTNDFDSLMYHMPLIVQWLHAGSLYAPDCAHWSLPGNNQLLGLWMVAPFSGDFLASLMNLPAGILLASSTVAVGRLVGLSRNLCHLAALAVVCNFVVFHQSVTAGNDLAVASLFLSTLCYGLRYLRYDRVWDLFLAAISLGLLVGVKYYALGYAALAWGVTGALALRDRGLRSGLQVNLVLGLGAVLWGGYWYLRNLLVAGSPLYPLGVTATTDAFGQLYPSTWSTTFLFNGSSQLLPLALVAVWKFMGPCQLVALVLLPVSVPWLVTSGLRSHRCAADGRVGTARLAVGLLSLGSALVLIVTPFAVEDQPGTLNHLRMGYAPVRYGMCLLSLAVVTLAWLLERLSSWPSSRIGICVTLAAATGYQFLYAAGAYTDIMKLALLAANFWTLALICYLCWARWARLRRAMLWAGGMGATIAAAVTIGYLSHNWHGGYALYYNRLFDGDLFSELAEADPTATRICVLDNRPYPFFGSARQFHVCQPLVVPSYSYLEKYLQAQRVTLVATRHVEGPDSVIVDRYRAIYQWLVERPERFVPWEQDPWFTVFQFRAAP